MKSFFLNRVLPLFLVVCISVTLSAPMASAAEISSAYQDTDSVEAWTAKFQNASMLAVLLNAMSNFLNTSLSTDCQWYLFNRIIGYAGENSGVGEVGLDDLQVICARYNSWFNGYDGPSNIFQESYWNGIAFRDSTIALMMGLGTLNFEIQEHPSSGLLRIKETTNDIWMVNSSGQYPYTESATSGGNQWIGERTVSNNISQEGAQVNLKSLDALNVMCNMLKTRYGLSGCTIKALGSKYKAIWYNYQYYCDPEGRPYVCWANESQSAVNQDRPDTSVTDENGDPVEGLPGENVTNIDLSGMTITLPDGSIQIADSVIYDESTKSYHIDSHDTYNYTTYNSYTWNYYINYTSITYIGQTEEYNKYYEVYYQLPDGRDSADLTAEELEQLNVSVDVINYGRSADDVSLRSLYHFDGDTRDSSYWNYCTGFTWNSGASLTYMESGNFEGCLYLDEMEHDFTLTLPSNLGTGDFTLQFRYYQSYTATPQTDSYIIFGNAKALQLDGSNLKDASGTVYSQYGVGSWHELALIRDSGTLYVYLNGLSVGSTSFDYILNNQILFHFGSSQQTYKQLDELRVLNFALASAGASYSCTSVPYDTNLTLVLPDTSTPVADEYYNVTFDEGAAYTANLTDNASFPSGTNIGGLSVLTASEGAYLSWSSTGGTSADDSTYQSNLDYTNSPYGNVPSSRILLSPTVSGISSYGVVYAYFAVIVEGQVYSLSASSTYYADPSYACRRYMENYTTVYFPGGALRLNGYGFNIFIDPSADPVCIQAVELIVSTDSSEIPSDSQFSIEHITSIVGIDTASLHSPTLAVRSDIQVTSYQIGGVRPTLPSKGQVWALVENNFITSLQIYNGQAWEGCDGRIWTGERWIPYSSYNIITLQDMYDVVDASSNYEYIYTESGFWSWWQKSWNAFTEKLFSALGSGSSGSGGTGGEGSSALGDVDLDAEDEVPVASEEDGKSLWQFILLVIGGGKKVISGTRHLFSGVVSTVGESMDQITGVFDSGGAAVGLLDGTGTDPDSSSSVTFSAGNESEVSDPWRYR